MKEKVYKYVPNQAVLKLIPENTSNILDIGCGNGDFVNYISKNIEIDGITISEEEFKQCSLKLNNVYLYDIEKGLPDNLPQYDIIIASHIIEHIAYPENLFSDIKEIMHKNSVFIVALPNIMHYKFRIKLLLGNFDYENTGIMDYTHLRWYTFKSAKKMLIKKGFIIQKAFVDSKLPFYRITKFLPQKVQIFIKHILYKISKGFFGMQLVYVVKKKIT